MIKSCEEELMTSWIFVTIAVCYLYLWLKKENGVELLTSPCFYVFNNATVKRYKERAVIIVMSLKVHAELNVSTIL